MLRRSPLRPLLRRALAVATLACVSAGTAAAQPFTSLTFFGDSFTDTGNGDIITAFFGAPDQTPTPPYAAGRASNGLVWADYLATALGQPAGAVPSLAGGGNYAVGTARTGVAGTLGLPIGMLSQASFFTGVSPVPGLPAVPHAGDPTGLYVLFGGSNDVFDAALLGSPAQQAMALSTAVDNLSLIATTLYGLGAREFLIPNLPDVGLAPLALGTPGSPVLSALSAQFNMLLDTRLAVLGASLPGSTFFGLHLDTLFDNILLDASQGGPRYGLTNTTIPCFAPGAPSCATSVFADGEHPTTAAHALIAQAAYDRVVNGRDVAAIAAVPEPMTVTLVAGGLLALGGVAAARRRRAA